MVNQSYLLLKDLPPALRVLYKPMLFISLGLHALLLITPMQQESKPKPKPEPAKKEEKVKISQLLAAPPRPATKPSPTAPPPTLKKAEPAPPPVAPLPKPKPRPNPIIEAPRPSETVTPKVIPTPEATPKTTPTPEASPQSTPTPEASPQSTTTPTPTPEITPKTAPNPNPNANTAATQNLFGQVEGVPDDLIDRNLFPQPESFFTPESLATEDGEAVRQFGIERIKWISLKIPDDVFTESIEPEAKNADLEVSLKGEYGGGNLYELKKKGTSVVRHISLVRSKGSIGTLIVVWSRDPSTPPAK